jgi:O-succinylhomoserine sulfhydrylase
MAAVFVSLAGLLRAGDHALFSRSLFGSTVQLANQILPRWGISTSYVSLTDTETWAEALQPTTRLLFIETPSNPGLDLIDLRAAADFCRRHNIILIVDNCFATPYLQKPLELGVHLVVHSATKWIDGQGRVLGGAIVGPADLIKELRFFARHTGPALSPFNAWTLSKSLETLHVRMDRHCATAHALAQWLEREFPDDLRAVRYPFLPSHPQYRLACEQMKAGGGIVCIVVRGGAQRAFRFVEALRWLSYTANLGDARTTVTHPASTTHSKLTEAEREVAGIEPGLIRISVGLEHLEDLQNELRQALVASRNA